MSVQFPSAKAEYLTEDAARGISTLKVGVNPSKGNRVTENEEVVEKKVN